MRVVRTFYAITLPNLPSLDLLKAVHLMTLLLQLNPHFFFTRDRSRGISPFTGKVICFSKDEQERLTQFTEGGLPHTSSDNSLLDVGAIIPKLLSSKVDHQIQSEIHASINAADNLVLMPTEQCNFRCTYCYEEFKLGGMSRPIVNAVKNYISKKVKIVDRLNLAWFGGEPLLQKEIVIEVTRLYTSLLSKYQTKGIASITTNGYLLNGALINDLLSSGLTTYHITLDGPKSIHDRQRRPKEGVSTYDRILDNVQELARHSDSRILIRINVDITSNTAVDEVENWISSYLINALEQSNATIDYYIVPVWDATTSSINGICLTKLDHFLNYQRLSNSILRFRHQDLGSQVAEKFISTSSLACYAGKPNNYVVGPDGSLYKCTVAFDLPENRVGQLNLDGTLSIDADRENKWTVSNALTEPGCNSCSFSKACQGIFCPLMRLQTGTPPCPTEKTFADEILFSHNPHQTS